MLPVENPDDSAARYLRLLAEAGIDVRDTLSWNSYPWYIGRPPNDQELDSALPVLQQILEMLPRLEVVMLQGATARQAWNRLTLAQPKVASRVQTIATYHTSARVIAHVPPVERVAASRNSPTTSPTRRPSSRAHRIVARPSPCCPPVLPVCLSRKDSHRRGGGR